MSKFSSPFLKKSPLNNEEPWYNKIMPQFIKDYVARGTNNRAVDLEKVASTKRTWKDLNERSRNKTPHLSDEMIADAPKIQVEHPITKKPVNMPFPYIKARNVDGQQQVVHTQGGAGNRIDYIPTIDSLNAADTPHNDTINPNVHELAREMVTDSLNLVNRGYGGEAINRYGPNLGSELRNSLNPQDFSKVVHTVLSNDGNKWYESARNFVRPSNTGSGGRAGGFNPATGKIHTDFSYVDNDGSSLTKPNRMNKLITNLYSHITGIKK